MLKVFWKFHHFLHGWFLHRIFLPNSFFKWSNLVCKARGCRVAFSAYRYFGQATFSLSKKKKCRDRCAQSTVRQSCSRNNVVEPVGKTSLALDTVFGHDLKKEETSHHLLRGWFPHRIFPAQFVAHCIMFVPIWCVRVFLCGKDIILSFSKVVFSYSESFAVLTDRLCLNAGRSDSVDSSERELSRNPSCQAPCLDRVTAAGLWGRRRVGLRG